MEKYPNGLPSHFFRDQKPKKDKKKKKKRERLRALDANLEPPAIRKQLKLGGVTNVSTRGSKKDGGENDSSADLTSFDANEINGSVNLSESERSSAGGGAGNV